MKTENIFKKFKCGNKEYMIVCEESIYGCILFAIDYNSSQICSKTYVSLKNLLEGKYDVVNKAVNRLKSNIRRKQKRENL